jgi:hypothetical protein
LRQVTKAAVEGETDRMMNRVVEVSKQLGITENAAKTLLRIVGEQTDVPDERLAEVLTKVANDYKRLQTQVAALDRDNPTAHAFVEQAKSEIAGGHSKQLTGFWHRRDRRRSPPPRRHRNSPREPKRRGMRNCLPRRLQPPLKATWP